MKTKARTFCPKRIAMLCLLAMMGIACTMAGVFSVSGRATDEEELFVVQGEKGVAGTVTAGAAMFSDNAAYKFDKPPANLTGASYISSPQEGDTYTVTSGNGYIYVLTVADNPFVTTGKPEGETSQSQNLQNDGFELVNLRFIMIFAAHIRRRATRMRFSRSKCTKSMCARARSLRCTIRAYCCMRKKKFASRRRCPKTRITNQSRCVRASAFGRTARKLSPKRCPPAFTDCRFCARRTM